MIYDKSAILIVGSTYNVWYITVCIRISDLNILKNLLKPRGIVYFLLSMVLAVSIRYLEAVSGE